MTPPSCSGAAIPTAPAISAIPLLINVSDRCRITPPARTHKQMESAIPHIKVLFPFFLSLIIHRLIPKSTDCQEHLRHLRMLLHLLPQALYQRGKRIVIDIIAIHIPQLFQNLLTGNGLVLMLHKQEKELVFIRRQLYRAVFFIDFGCLFVDADIPAVKASVLRPAVPHPAQQSPYP